MNPPDLDSIVEVLEDDAFRRGGSITMDVILRAAEKRHLDAVAIAEVRRRLLQREVAIEGDDTEAEDGDAEATVATTDDADGVVPANEYENDERARHVLDLYFRDVRSHRTLKPQDEIALFRRIRAGENAAAALEDASEEETAVLQRLVEDGKKAREEVVNANLRLVAFVENEEFKHRRDETSHEDLIQEGNIGLLRAVDGFDHTRSLRFSTYAYWWIWSRMKRSLDDKGRLVRVPVYLRERIATVLRTRSFLAREAGGRPPAIEDIAAHLGWEPEKVQFLLDLQVPVVSLDQAKDRSGRSLSDVKSSPEPLPSEHLEKAEIRQVLLRFIATVDERAAAILRKRFGLDGGTGRTLEELGAEFNLTRERVRQIEAKALEQFRHPLRARFLRELLQPSDDPPPPDARALRPHPKAQVHPKPEKIKGRKAHVRKHRRR